MDIKEVLEFLYERNKEYPGEACYGVDCQDCPFEDFTTCPNSFIK